MTTRHRALQRPLDKIEHLRHEERGLLDAEIPPLTFPELGVGSTDATRSVAFAAVTQVTVLGGGQLGRMLGLAGIPLGLSFRFLDPSADAPAAAVGELVVGGLDDVAAAPRAAAGADGRHLRVGRRARRDRARAAQSTSPVLPVGARARGLAGPARREGDVPRARDRDRAVPRRRRSRRRSTPRSRDSGCPRCSKTRRGGYDGKGQAVLRVAGRRRRRVGSDSAACRCILEGFVPFRPRAVDRRGARRATATIACWPVVENTAPRRHPAPDPRAGARARRRAPGARRGVHPAAARRRSTTSACAASSCSTSTARCSPTRWRPACTTPGTGRSRARRPASSRTTCARSSAGRSARPRRAASSAMVNCIGDDARPRRGPRDPGRAPPRLRQGAAPRPQGRPRHRDRRRRERARRPRSRASQALVAASTDG